jgi:hypothetical protein
MADGNDGLWVGLIVGGAIVAVIASIVYVGYYEGWFTQFTAVADTRRALPVLKNKETISWTDNKGREHIIKVDREVS